MHSWREIDFHQDELEQVLAHESEMQFYFSTAVFLFSFLMYLTINYHLCLVLLFLTKKSKRSSAHVLENVKSIEYRRPPVCSGQL